MRRNALKRRHIMSEKTDNRNNSQSRLSNTYRVVVYDDDTLAEVRTTRVSGISVAIAILVFFILSSLLTAALISFTPLKYLVPGYADITNNRAYVEINEKLQALEIELDAQRTYTNGIKNMLNPSGTKVQDITSMDEESMSIASDVGLPLDNFFFHCPLSGEVSSAFDKDKKHFGVDIIAEKDSPVKCILDGVVINADWSAKTGNTISIQHRNNIVSVYKHNSKLLKNTGENVKAGEAIAIIGNTGLHSSGPHVHFELWNMGQPVDPLDYIHIN